MRIALGVEYDGANFNGWQIQAQGQGYSVQGRVEQALAKVANHEVRTFCAGRTDSGVHATGQIIHFDSEAVRKARGWVLGANAHLPDDVAVIWAKPVSDAFHARFSAQRRRYRYVIYSRPVRPTFLARRVTWEYRTLDIERMQAAASYLLGEHDFSSFRAYGCQAKSPVRTVHELKLSRSGERGEFIMLDIEANAFLHHMVRNIVGVLSAIGAGERPVEWAREVLEYRDRKLGGVTAPPYGLYLVGVEYPEEFGIPYLSPPQMVW
ncbi:MAG TPA: tRNA pseudouridine(38-40) synthase TruA [Chromatiales bacterium]|nr:tRNA pseudouridine(38-40) synthase TruA [Chromatiales bacterium]